MSRPDISIKRAAEIAAEHFSIDAIETKELGGYIDRNFLIKDANGTAYVLKAHSHADSDGVVNLQADAVEFLAGQNLSFDLPRQKGETIWDDDDANEKTCFRLIAFLQGQLLCEYGSLDATLLGSAGQVTGSLDAALTRFDHPAAGRRELPWDLQNAPETKRCLSFITNPAARRRADYFFLQYEMEAAPALALMERSISHNDCHRYALMSVDGKNVSGVIDFGDTVLTYPICNLAISISDLLVGQTDLPQAVALIAAGYHKNRPLSEVEIDLLHILVGTRLAIYLCMAAKAKKDDPDNTHSQMKHQDVEQLISKWVKLNPVAISDAVRLACGFQALSEELNQKKKTHIANRDRFFSKSLYTHYDDPLFLTGGAFEYLFDSEGRQYLDLVNNVCQTGHCHPVIVRSVQHQLCRLNTNSRYLYESMGDYAEKLLATFPDELDTVFFVNSGSEANDLAMRMARSFTGHSDMAVIDTAYHGNSTVCTDISPNRIDGPGKPGLPGYVHKIPVPDRYRGEHGYDDDDAGFKYASAMGRLIDDLKKHDKGIAAFYAESLIGTGGQIVLPSGYLESIYSQVRSAGGICIADEVQMGFGRIGSHFWCFESQNVVPDIVTMGKPMANGHPMGAVVTRREIANAFDNGITYFNTFGGNPVACTAASAVIDVMETEKLQENCLTMGNHLIGGLEALKEIHPIIGDVRGLGLYLGVELVRDRETKEPAISEAKVLVEVMKSRGFLTNTNGYLSNVLKFKPPLLVEETDIDRVVAGLDESLSDLNSFALERQGNGL